jgi:hypothetical protein
MRATAIVEGKNLMICRLFQRSRVSIAYRFRQAKDLMICRPFHRRHTVHVPRNPHRAYDLWACRKCGRDWETLKG